MNELSKLLQTLCLKCIRLWPQEGKLRYRGVPQQVTPEVLAQLQQHKAGLLQQLSESTDSPLSYGQKGLWYIQQSAPDSSVYHVSLALRIRSKQADLDTVLLQNAFQLLLNRHASLRTTFPIPEDRPVQRIAGYQEVDFTQIDSSAWSEDELLAQVQIAHTRPFDLANGPLLRAVLFSQSPQEHLFVLSIHHIIVDGWSIYLLLDELFVFYDALQQGITANLPLIDHTYADYVTWQHTLLQRDGERLWSYWQEQVGGSLPVLQLPTDYRRPPLQSYRGISHSFQLSTALTQQLKTVAQQNGCTLYVLLLAAYQTFLYRYSGQDELLIGLPMAGRSRPEFSEIVGYFTSPIVTRANLSDDPTFLQLLARVRRQVFGALDHQDYPFALLVEKLNPARDSSRSPIFQTDFVLQKPHRAQELILSAGPSEKFGLLLESVPLALFAGHVDLSLEMSEMTDGLLGSLKANSDLFDRTTIERMAGHFQTLLQAIAHNPEQPITQLPLLSAAERHQLLVEWNDTASDYPKDKTIHQLFEEQVARTPDAVAVIMAEEQPHKTRDTKYEIRADLQDKKSLNRSAEAHERLPISQSLTYQELNSRANQLAHYLRSLGVGPDVLVGICVERSLEMVVGLLGILKAGGAYVPLDPSYPQERLNFMLHDAQISILLTQAHLARKFPHSHLSFSMDTDWDTIHHLPTSTPKVTMCAEQLAYVIYTSGSTGQPKGVMIRHCNVSNLIHWHQAVYGLTPQDRTTQVAGPAFDAVVWELWSALTAGAAIYIMDEGTRAVPERILQWWAEHSITLSFLPTPLAEALLSLPLPNHLALRLLLTGGDVLHLNPHSTLPFTLVNNYGPTENTVVTTWAPLPTLQSLSLLPPIGKPIFNTQVYLLDGHDQLVPVGVIGELHIGGDSLACGYHNHPELTQEKFIDNPFGEGKLYKTGDLCRWLADGNIEYLGRIDHQVKIRGFRIELGEIEAVLSQHPDVEEAVVVAREDVLGEKRLVAYIVSDKATRWQGDKVNNNECTTLSPCHPLTLSTLRSHLQARLPDYMIPSTFVLLNALPLTPNGKVERKALPAPDISTLSPTQDFAPPSTPTECAISGIWAAVLGIERIGIHDNFFALGGHSLLATQVVSRIKSILHTDISLRALFENPTIKGLSERVQIYGVIQHMSQTTHLAELDTQKVEEEW